MAAIIHPLIGKLLTFIVAALRLRRWKKKNHKMPSRRRIILTVSHFNTY
jgi:hypothetical protein